MRIGLLNIVCLFDFKSVAQLVGGWLSGGGFHVSLFGQNADVAGWVRCRGLMHIFGLNYIFSIIMTILL